MLKINIFAVGSIKEQYLKDSTNEYLKRLSKYCSLNIIETKEEKIQNNGEEKTKELESNEILKRIKPDEYVVLLDLHGNELTSEEFATYIKSLEDKGTSPINFVIAGTLGFSKKLIDRANYRVSLSKMTFPHQIARVLLLEQLYRAFKINRNESYHH